MPEAQFIADDTFKREIHTDGVKTIILYLRLNRLLRGGTLLNHLFFNLMIYKISGYFSVETIILYLRLNRLLQGWHTFEPLVF